MKSFLTGMALVILMAICNVAAATEVVTYYYTDAQGTPLATTDGQGNIITVADYRPYATQALGQSAGGPGYTGHVNDADTELVYMQARYYDPSVGRFLSTDPIEPASANISNFSRYQYAGNSPLVRIDPDGRAAGPPESSEEDIEELQEEMFPKLGPNMAVAPVPVAQPAIEEIDAKTFVDFSNKYSPIDTPTPKESEPMARGRQKETEVLQDIGQEKNTAVHFTSQGKTIPDFQDIVTIGEIKDTKRVTDSSQLRGQRESAESSGRQHVIITGTNTRVSATVQSQSIVLRRDDLGPGGKAGQ